MHRIHLIPLLVAIFAAGAAQAQEPAAVGAGESWESAAKKLQQATVTVRIWGDMHPAGEPAAEAQPSVTVISGVCVREGQIVTAAFAGSDTRIRLTLPGGKQADAKVQLIDEYSGLALLQATTEPLTPLVAASESPTVGSGVLTAAAWGVEQPIVSQGIVSGVDRTRQGANYPPLLQCDLRTTETSSGSGIVNRQGELLGVLVAADDPQARRGWAYAVPVSHVERILRSSQQQRGEGVIILKRRRPVVGLVLDQDGEAIVVQRLTPGGPAEKAGFRVGDQIVTTEGVAIRSVYQAVLPSLYKQPGDTMTFRIERDGRLQELQVVLGGGVELPSAPLDLLVDLVQPKVELQRDPRGGYIARGQGAGTRALASPPLPDDEQEPAAPTSAEKIALLEKALDRYRTVIELQQKQLQDEQKHRQNQDETIQAMRSELEALRKLITPKK